VCIIKIQQINIERMKYRCFVFCLWMTVSLACQTRYVAPEPPDKSSENVADTLAPPSVAPPVIPAKKDTFSIDSSLYWYESLPNKNTPYCESGRFGAANRYTESELDQRSGIFATHSDYLGRPQKLNFIFMAPANDTLARRPFILLVHEGAFLFGDMGTELGLARLLARKGYAVAVINYRLGYPGGSETNPCGGTSEGVLRALYRSVQDIRAALRYFTSQQNVFGLDPNQFFLAGSSAGSVAITALSYMTEADFEKRSPGIVRELGLLNGPDIGAGASYRVRALLTYLGYGILDVELATPAKVRPMLMVQGAEDKVLPYDSGPLYGCGGYFVTHGSRPMARRLSDLKQPYEWIVQPGSGHIISYTAEYISERYAEFIKRLWCDDLRQIEKKGTTTVGDRPID
jgi:acetyl esterase/lipase